MICLFKYLQQMRIFIVCTDDDGTRRTNRLFLDNCSSTSTLLKEISRETGIARAYLIVRLKYEPHHLRIVDNWPLEHYPIRNGSTFIVEINDERACRDLSLSTEPLARVKEEDDFDSEDQEEHMLVGKEAVEGVSTKYLEQCLEEMLAAVKGKDLERVAQILREQPEVQDESDLKNIIEKRYQYLLNQVGDNGRNVLHEAIDAGSTEIVSFLLIKGTDPSLTTSDDFTPLQMAIKNHSPEMLSLLLQQSRIDVNELTSKGTALHVAAQMEDLRCIQVLFQNDADTEIVDNYGKRAIELTHNQNIRKLIQKKAEIRKAAPPFIARGTIFKATNITYRLKQRTLLINPFKNEFSLTDSKERQQKFQLSAVESVQEIEDRSWLMSSDYSYFKVTLKDKQKTELIFAVKHEQILQKWFSSFRAAVKWRQNCAYTKPVPQSEQLIQLLNDHNNQTTVHKRKVDPPKKTMSILNMLPGQQEPDHALKIRSRLSMRKSDRRFINFSQEYVMEQSQLVLGSIVRGLDSTNQSQRTGSEYASVVQSNMEPSFLDRELSKDRFRKNSLNRSQYIVSEFRSEQGRPIVSFREFQIVRLLGSGSFGQVFEAKWARDNKTYALKVLNKSKLIKKKQLKYAVGQATILKKVDHPFVISLHLSFQTPQNLYLALDHCPHGDLAQLITVRQKLTQPTARFVIAQVVLALEYLHSKNILYRDLKPQNILIASDKFVRLTDFGLSRENSFSMSFCGSPAYLSPEMLQRKGVGFASDIYGIGCILFEMLVGEPPFFDENIDTLYDNIRSGKLRYPSHLSIQAKSIISKLIQRDATKRLGYKNFSDIKNHDFFKKIDWSALLQGRVHPPGQMLLQDPQNFYEIELEQAEPIKISDTDYDASTDKSNRIKNFTFVRHPQ